MRLLLLLLFLLPSIALAEPWLITDVIPPGPYQPTHYNLFVNGEPKGSATAVSYGQLGAMRMVFDLAWFEPYYKRGVNTFSIESCRNDVCGPRSNEVAFSWPFVRYSDLRLQLLDPAYRRIK